MAGRFIFTVLLSALFSPPAVWSLQDSEPNNTLADAQPLKIWETVTGYFQKEGDADWFRLDIDTPGRQLLRIDMTPVPEVDTFISVFDASGNHLMMTNTGGKGDGESIINLGVTKGIYYIQLGSSNENMLMQYTLRTALIGSWHEGMEYEPNDLIRSANSLSVGKTVRGYLYPSYDEDWYGFSASGEGKMLLQISLSMLPGVDTRIDVYDESGEKIIRSMDGGGAGDPEKIINLVVLPGRYFVKISSDTSDFNGTFEYTLRVESPGPWQENMELEPNDTKINANMLQPGRAVSGYLYPDGDVDRFVLTADEASPDILSISLSAVPGANTTLELLDEEDRLLHQEDNGNEGEAETIIGMRLPAGKYYVAVHGTGANENTGYELKFEGLDLAPVGEAEMREALTKALDYLAAEQQSDGAWPGTGGNEAGMAGLGLMAFLGAEYAEKDYASNITDVIQYLKGQYPPRMDDAPAHEDGSGSGGVMTASGSVQSLDIVTLSLVEAFAASGDAGLEPMIEDALKQIIRWQNTEHKPEDLNGPVSADSLAYGGWGNRPWDRTSSVSMSAGRIMVLRAAMVAGFKVPEWSLEKAARFFRAWYDNDEARHLPAARREDADIAAAALQICGYPGDPRVAEGMEFLKLHLPVWQSSQAGPGLKTFQTWYYRTLAMKNAGKDAWLAWKHRLCRLLVDHQDEDGSWTPEPQASTAHKIMAVNLAAQMLALCSGYVPAYLQEQGQLVVSMQRNGAPVIARRMPGTVEIILDASNSMWGRIGGIRKIDLAREALSGLIQELPEDMGVGLRVYGHQYYYRKSRCADSELVVPPESLDRTFFNQVIREIKPRGMTPIAFSLQKAGEDLTGIEGEKVVILVSDGSENCQGDPAAAAGELVSADSQMQCHVIGFGLRDRKSGLLLRDISEACGGLYFEAGNAEELRLALGEAVEKTLRPMYTVYDHTGREIFSDAAGGEARNLKAGSYRLVLDADPPMTIDQLLIQGSQETQVRIKKTEQGLEAEVH